MFRIKEQIKLFGKMYNRERTYYTSSSSGSQVRYQYTLAGYVFEGVPPVYSTKEVHISVFPVEGELLPESVSDNFHVTVQVENAAARLKYDENQAAIKQAQATQTLSWRRPANIAQVDSPTQEVFRFFFTDDDWDVYDNRPGRGLHRPFSAKPWINISKMEESAKKLAMEFCIQVL